MSMLIKVDLGYETFHSHSWKVIDLMVSKEKERNNIEWAVYEFEGREGPITFTINLNKPYDWEKIVGNFLWHTHEGEHYVYAWDIALNLKEEHERKATKYFEDLVERTDLKLRQLAARDPKARFIGYARHCWGDEFNFQEL